MRILQVITSLMTGGAERLIVDITKRLREYGHVVDVVVFNGVETPFMRQLERTGCRIYLLSIGGSVYNPRYILDLRKIMRDYDIVHTHNTSPQFFTAIASVFTSKIAAVTTEHNTSNRRRNNKLWRPIDRWMYNRYRHVICISDQAEKNLRAHLGSKHHTPITTIYNGIDVDACHSAEPIAGMHPANKFVVVMVAAFRKQKDQKTLIEAIAQLPQQEFELWLAGDGDTRAEIEQFVVDKNLAQQVKFLGNRTDVPNLLHTADAICMSSHYEGLSLSNLEGMSAGRPFIATDVDGLREVTAGYGILFPHEDAAALAKIIKKLRDDKAYYQKTAEDCYRRACMFDIKRMIDAYEAIYRQILNQE